MLDETEQLLSPPRQDYVQQPPTPTPPQRQMSKKKSHLPNTDAWEPELGSTDDMTEDLLMHSDHF